ncbi:MAG: DUF6883 domain-containing protein [Candidatus Kapaibacterium sp.]
MIIPKDAIIAIEKVRDYLLKPRIKHDKSGFLRLAGYEREQYEILLNDIRDQFLPSEAQFQERKKYGEYYAIRGFLQGPNGRQLRVKTVWIVDLQGDIRFVTLVPN